MRSTYLDFYPIEDSYKVLLGKFTNKSRKIKLKSARSPLLYIYKISSSNISKQTINQTKKENMEVFFLCSLSPLLLITFFIIICVSLATIFNRNNKLYKSNNSNNNLPPGKMGLPYIGESLEFLNSGRKGFPEKFIYDRMAKYSSQVFKTSILGEPTVVVCGAIANKFLFSNENKLVQAWWPDSVNKIFPSSTQTSSKEEAKKMRKLLPNFLKPEALMRYVGMMDSIAQKHFESGWEGKQQVAVFALAKRFTFSVACKVFLSIEDSQHVAKLAVPFDALASGIISVPIDLPGTPFNRAIKASKFIRKELIAIIKQRKTELAAAAASSTTPAHHHHHQDILSHMLLAADENGQHMSELDVADKILGLLIGGHDTASAAITFIVKYLAELPHIYNQVLNGNFLSLS